jgi:hypothetical protein
MELTGEMMSIFQKTSARSKPSTFSDGLVLVECDASIKNLPASTQDPSLSSSSKSIQLHGRGSFTW